MISVAYFAVWFFVFSVPWENVIGISGLGAISRLTGMIALGLAMLAAVVNGRVRKWHSFHVAALLFVVWAGCTVLIFELEAIPKKFWTYVQLFLVLWMIWELAPSRKRQLGLLLAYVLGAYVSAFSTIMVSRRQMGMEQRFAATGFDANDLAGALALALPMAWYLAMTFERPLLRWICRGYLPVGLVAIGLTGSRGGMIATIVALLIVPLTMSGLSPGKLVAAIAMLWISGSLAVVYIPETVVKRLASTSADVQEGRLGGRGKIWVAGVQAFARRPLLGYGTSGFRTAIRPYIPTVPQVAHNSFLSVLVENGILGFSFFAWMLIAVFRALRRLPLLDRRFGLVLFATLLIVMLPLTWEDQKPTWVVLAILLGVARSRPQLRPSVSNRPYQRVGAPAGPQPLASRGPAPRGRWNPSQDRPA